MLAVTASGVSAARSAMTTAGYQVLVDPAGQDDREIRPLVGVERRTYRSGIDEPADRHDGVTGEVVRGGVHESLVDRQPEPVAGPPVQVALEEQSGQRDNVAVDHLVLRHARRDDRDLAVAPRLPVPRFAVEAGRPRRPVQDVAEFPLAVELLVRGEPAGALDVDADTQGTDQRRRGHGGMCLPTHRSRAGDRYRGAFGPRSRSRGYGPSCNRVGPHDRGKGRQGVERGRA
jgi:hypothetical protein